MTAPDFFLLGSLNAYESLGMRKSHRHLPTARDASGTSITSRDAISGEHLNTNPSSRPDSRTSTSSRISGLNRPTHHFLALYRTRICHTVRDVPILHIPHNAPRPERRTCNGHYLERMITGYCCSSLLQPVDQVYPHSLPYF
jgi:hypothetical protein